MKALGVAAFLVIAASSGALEPTRVRGDATFDALVQSIRQADYRGDRVKLAALGQELASRKATVPAERREYWIGFAWWRRAINGFNETPVPADLFADLQLCAEHNRAALVANPGFEDAQGALFSCLGMQIGIAPTPQMRAQIIAAGSEVFKGLLARKAETNNPRTLWILSGYEAFRGDLETATATLLRGLELARAERAGPQRDAAMPSWGEAELLMSLAYLNTIPGNAHPAVARGFAEAALLLVPNWHYVHDILIPQIAALPPGPRAVSTK